MEQMMPPRLQSLKITEDCAPIFPAGLHLKMSALDQVTQSGAAANRTGKEPPCKPCRVAPRAKFDYRLMGSAFDLNGLSKGRD